MPNTGDNGVHASASPFEALAEQMNWLGRPLESLGFGQAMLASGIQKGTIEEWSVDPQVVYGPTQIRASIFDTLEDTDAGYCLALAGMVNGGGSSSGGCCSTGCECPCPPLVHCVMGLVLGVALGFFAAKRL
jgi:hypothetical protein